MISLKSRREIDVLQEGGKILANVLRDLGEFVKPGMRTIDIDERAAAQISRQGAEVAFKGYRGFPANICASVNEEVVHGIPSDRRLKEGDILSVDIGVKYKGYFTDAARTWAVGRASEGALKLIRTTREALFEAALPQMISGKRVGDISNAIQKYVESRGYGVVRDFVGHGIGQAIHEEPQVPNFGRAGRGLKLEPGLVLAIEPMVTMGDHEVMILDNSWTVVTCDRGIASHHEDTIAITEEGPLVLTSWKGEV